MSYNDRAVGELLWQMARWMQTIDQDVARLPKSIPQFAQRPLYPEFELMLAEGRLLREQATALAARACDYTFPMRVR